MATTINKIIIGIGGGKGGIGKSICSSNLGVALAQRGKKVIIVDADLGAANLHSLFGIVNPSKTMDDFMLGNIDDLNQVLLPTELPNLHLICGGIALVGLADPTFAQKGRLISALNTLEADYLIVDIGAGTSSNALDFYNNSHIKLLVLSAQITSIQNCYVFLKSAVYQKIQRTLARQFGKDDPRLKNIDVIIKNAENVKDIFKVLDKLNPQYREVIEQELLHYNTYIVGNMLREPKQKEAITSMLGIVKDYLQLQANLLGILNYSKEINDSINNLRPFMLSQRNRNHPECMTFDEIADQLIEIKIDLDFHNRDNLFEAGKFAEPPDPSRSTLPLPQSSAPTPTTFAISDTDIDIMRALQDKKTVAVSAHLTDGKRDVQVTVRMISMRGVLVAVPSDYITPLQSGWLVLEVEGDALRFPVKMINFDAAKRILGLRFAALTRLKTIVLHEIFRAL